MESVSLITFSVEQMSHQALSDVGLPTPRSSLKCRSISGATPSSSCLISFRIYLTPTSPTPLAYLAYDVMHIHLVRIHQHYFPFSLVERRKPYRKVNKGYFNGIILFTTHLSSALQILTLPKNINSLHNIPSLTSTIPSLPSSSSNKAQTKICSYTPRLAASAYHLFHTAQPLLPPIHHPPLLPRLFIRNP